MLFKFSSLSVVVFVKQNRGQSPFGPTARALFVSGHTTTPGEGGKKGSTQSVAVPAPTEIRAVSQAATLCGPVMTSLAKEAKGLVKWVPPERLFGPGGGEKEAMCPLVRVRRPVLDRREVLCCHWCVRPYMRGCALTHCSIVPLLRVQVFIKQTGLVDQAPTRMHLKPNTSILAAVERYQQIVPPDGEFLEDTRNTIIDENGYTLDPRLYASPLSDFSQGCNLNLEVHYKYGKMGTMVEAVRKKTTDLLGWAEGKTRGREESTK